MKLLPGNGAGEQRKCRLEGRSDCCAESIGPGAAELSLIENLLREELNPLEEADAYVTLIEKVQSFRRNPYPRRSVKTVRPLPIRSGF